MLECTIIYIVLITEHNEDVSAEYVTDWFGEITEPLYGKYDKTRCGGRTCEIPLRSVLSKYIQTRSTNTPAIVPLKVSVRINNEQQ